jgi:hypothetical protein
MRVPKINARFSLRLLAGRRLPPIRKIYLQRGADMAKYLST